MPDDELYFPFRMKWLGKWTQARYLATLEELKDRYGTEYVITGPGIVRHGKAGGRGASTPNCLASDGK
jgi:hypothetical protein